MAARRLRVRQKSDLNGRPPSRPSPRGVLGDIGVFERFESCHRVGFKCEGNETDHKFGWDLAAFGKEKESLTPSLHLATEREEYWAVPDDWVVWEVAAAWVLRKGNNHTVKVTEGGKGRRI